MAVAGLGPVTLAAPEPVGTFTVDIGASFWRPKRPPYAGDLVVLCVARPAEVVQPWPAGWTPAGDGRTFWKVWANRDQETATFHARAPGKWEIKGWVVDGGTYQLP